MSRRDKRKADDQQEEGSHSLSKGNAKTKRIRFDEEVHTKVFNSGLILSRFFQDPFVLFLLSPPLFIHFSMPYFRFPFILIIANEPNHDGQRETVEPLPKKNASHTLDRSEIFKYSVFELTYVHTKSNSHISSSRPRANRTSKNLNFSIWI
jgi:hypothetical protein